ncbi:3-hydroxyacyl-ACP dehydratase FabZ family protein [Streptomyces sp. NPDC053780]|uniref:3-hydroxyacyl-ACP dehydratase FabZ family protein n=1 Tax=unclassified Streptomyces TaxID=2593676 RepID=UPI000F742F27|nr:3-hydroxyacyl-ACP dehydratase [Streptomyces sp. WAC 04229]RSN54768.1 3-hydroxyacyl-ACP dehydratase [Streptomyces sp. WAC 04229]
MTAHGLDRIKSTIPHRGELLLVDRVTEVEPGRRLTALKAISGNEPCYAPLGRDAAPADYAYPTSLVVESWAQSAVLLSVWEAPNPDVLAGKVELAGSINDVVFGVRAHPGEVLEHRVRLVKAVGETAILTGETCVGGREALRVGSFVVALRDVTELLPAPALLNV